jgi:hypothetical protein
MTNDSKLFPPRPKWEAKGYVPDEYGHWLQGNWQPVGHAAWRTSDWETAHWSRARSILRRPEGVILSRDGMQMIHVGDISDVALPLYEGRMIDHFDFSAKGWVSGKGRSAVWRDIPWEHKVIEPQFLMASKTLVDSKKAFLGPKLAFMPIGSATNQRTLFVNFVDYIPCGHSVSLFVSKNKDFKKTLKLIGVLSSFAFDSEIRARLGGLNISEFLISETSAVASGASQMDTLMRQSAQLAMSSISFSEYWKALDFNGLWRRNFALSVAERVRLQVINDALVGYFFGLDQTDYRALFDDCDHPSACVRSDAFARTLDPKGFWRVDKEKDPELRHTVLAQVAFADLQKMGLDAFLSQNNGEGWMLPENLRLADYGLGQGDYRASQPLPVASRLGPRFYDWQLEGTVEESWEECRRHADLIKTIRKH